MQIVPTFMRGIKQKTAIQIFLLLAAFILISLFDQESKAAGSNNTSILLTESGIYIGKKNQQPVVTIGSKIFAPQDILINNDALISWSYKIGEGIPEEIIQGAVRGSKKGLHLLIDLSREDIQNEEFPIILENMSQYGLSFWVSLIPNQELPQKEYDEYYYRLRTHLSEKGIRNISLVWYPDVFTHQGVEDWLEVDGVGVNISDSGDMAHFDMVYKMFAGQKAVIINENIAESHSEDLKRGLDFLKSFYYSLAYKYPAVTAVYQSSDLGLADIKYQKTIDGLKHRSWAAYTRLENSDQPMFEPLKEYGTLSGQAEFLYRPQNDHYHNIAYVEYKFNNNLMIQTQRPPFEVKVDTNKLHNGINSLVAVVYNKQLKIIDRHHIYFKAANKNIPLRAKRLEQSYSLDQKPVYASSYIPVLMYHDFAPEVSGEKASITLSAHLFESQLKALLDEGYTPITFNQLNNFLSKKTGLPLKPVIITSDDAYLSNFTIAYPLLKKYGIPATFFVTTDFMGVDTQFPHITWAQAKEMEKSGLIDIQSHTHRHQLFNLLTEKEVAYETSISFGLIEKNLGKRDVKVLSYPEFRNTADNRKWVQWQGVDFQVTDLAKRQSVTTKQNVQRIHVHNNMSPQDLINTIRYLTR